MFLFQVDQERNEDEQERQSDRVRERERERERDSENCSCWNAEKVTFQTDKDNRLTNFSPIVSINISQRPDTLPKSGDWNNSVRMSNKKSTVVYTLKWTCKRVHLFISQNVKAKKAVTRHRWFSILKICLSPIKISIHTQKNGASELLHLLPKPSIENKIHD